jgi:DNA-directed RNA polymerase subunit RPC12/RpoP
MSDDDPPDDIHGGKYYRFAPDGHARAAPGVPDVVVCRRLADFPGGRPPEGAAVIRCAECGHYIAFNARGPHPDRPHVCMQCADIRPLPFPQ